MRPITILLIIICTHPLFAQNKNRAALKALPWKTATTDSYSVKYPRGWELDMTARMGTLFFIFAPPTSANDKFKENLNLMTEDVSTYNVTLDKYVDGSKGSVTNALKNAKFQSDTKEKINGRECRHLMYTGEQKDFDLQFEAYIFMVRNRAYIFTFTGEQKNYNIYSKTVREAAATLNFK